jgi:hypothetical protein
MTVSIIDAIADPELLGHRFADIASWRSWLTVLRALFGLPMDSDDKARFKECTGRSKPNPAGDIECWLACGRRSGKSRILATIAVYLAAFQDWEQHLAPAEYGTVMVLARDRSPRNHVRAACTQELAVGGTIERVGGPIRRGRYSSGSMQVKTLRRKYSSFLRP